MTIDNYGHNIYNIFKKNIIIKILQKSYRFYNFIILRLQKYYKKKLR